MNKSRHRLALPKLAPALAARACFSTDKSVGRLKPRGASAPIRSMARRLSRSHIFEPAAGRLEARISSMGGGIRSGGQEYHYHRPIEGPLQALFEVRFAVFRPPLFFSSRPGSRMPVHSAFGVFRG